MTQIEHKPIYLVQPTFPYPDKNRGLLYQMTLDDFLRHNQLQSELHVAKVLKKDPNKNFGLVAFVPFHATSPHYVCIASFPLGQCDCPPPTNN